MGSLCTPWRRHMRRVTAGVFGLVGSVISLAAFSLPQNFTIDTVVSGLRFPVNIQELPDGRMLVLQKEGEIVLFDPNDPAPVRATSYLTLPDIETDIEQGLASIALHPNFDNNGLFYLYYTKDSLNKNVIARFEHLGDRARPSSERVIWADNERIGAPSDPDCRGIPGTQNNTRPNHFGGGMDFGPDGKLYLATGDEFDPCQAQDLNRAGGKIIRINADGSVPGDNPKLGGLPEIYAYGLRNPYRAHFDLVKNRFYVGEVGGNIQATATEDLHLGKEGANYGWAKSPCEGPCANPGHDDPIYFYRHDPNARGGRGGAITAGTVYRGSQFPSQYNEAFFFSDYALGFIKYLRFDNRGRVIDRQGDNNAETDNAYPFAAAGDNIGAPVAMELGQDGSLYVVDYLNGRIRRISYNAPGDNQPPEITSTTPTGEFSASVNASVAFSVTANDPDGPNDAMSYTWTFGDGSSQSGRNVSHRYTEPGMYDAYVVVSDGAQSTFSEHINVIVGAQPTLTTSVYVCSVDDTQCSAQNPTRILFQAGDEIRFSADARTSSGARIDDYEWDIQFGHLTHFHPEQTSLNTQSGTLTLSAPAHDYHDTTYYQFTVRVSDPVTGITTSEMVDIFPDKVDISLRTAPVSGIPITLDGQTHSSPINNYDTAVNYDHGVAVPEFVCVDGTPWEFIEWSDGAQIAGRPVTVPSANFTLTARYAHGTGVCASGIPTSNLVAHYEADRITTSGNQITGWPDQSGKGNHLSIAGNPQVVAGALNGNPVIDFDGSGDRAQRTAPLRGFPKGNRARTVYLVANYRGSGIGGLIWGEKRGNQAFGLVVSQAGNLLVEAYGGRNRFETSERAIGAGWVVQSAIVTGGTLKHYKDGTLIDSRPHTFNTKLGDLYLGAGLNRRPQIDMQVAAAFVYDKALNATERARIEDYINNKYASGTVGNQPPNALDDGPINVTEASSVIIDVLANDYDPDDDGIDESSLRIIDAPMHGEAEIDAGTVQYTHLGGGTGTDSFKYRVRDALGLWSSAASVSLVIDTGTNAAPVAVNDTASTPVDEAVTVNVAGNDTDTDGLIVPATVSVTSQGSMGRAVSNGNGTITYTPAANATVGTDNFRYSVKDDDGATSNHATVWVTLTGFTTSTSLPTDGLVLHLESDTGVTTNGGANVTSWADRSGKGNTLTNIGTPMRVSNVFNGKPAIRFDGESGYLQRRSGVSGLPSGNADRTAFVVVKYHDIGLGGFAWGIRGKNQTFGLSVSVGGELTIQGWGNANDFPAGGTVTDGQALIHSAIVADNVLTHYRDGATLESRAHTYATAIDRIVLGVEIDLTPRINMEVGAVLVYDRALSSTEYQDALRFLSQKYLGR